MRTSVKGRLALYVVCLLLFLLAPLAVARRWTVTQVNLTFTPDTVTVAVGDTVAWVWTSGSHTVTNGLGAADPDAGSMFDEFLNSSNPFVEFVFTQVGEVPYFCRPYEALGMKGRVFVRTTAVENATWSKLKALFK
ncbi:MAG: plastocyanin/azurin family copper-binding protein [Candidatus Eisenbacteria bacterium]